MLYPLYDYYFASKMTLTQITEHYIHTFYLRNMVATK